jgi:cytosolic carboxypeptidase protein 5
MMSFIHRIPDKRETVSYFAFCFPHSYEECQQMLEKYDQKFEHCRTLSPNKT